MAIEVAKEILGEDQDKAYIRLYHFSTNFNGTGSVTVTNFLSAEAREKGVNNGINEGAGHEFKPETIDTIQKLVYADYMESIEGAVEV